MITERYKICCLITFWCCINILCTFGFAYSIQTGADKNNLDQNIILGAPQHVTVRNFSPHVNYNNNEWRPVGRGDPLKNDPTYDYSPPTLDRVRYWAETNNTNSEENDIKNNTIHAVTDRMAIQRSNNKKDILLLGVPKNVLNKNAKGEIPLLQPKYPPIRRSYYAHHLPTRLMPPPMHSIASSPNALHKPQMPEYRHIMQPHISSPPHWNLHSSRFDTHFAESGNYVNYARPSTQLPIASSHYYSPNAIRLPQSALKQTSAPRKPWLHELLQKEFVQNTRSTTKKPTTQIPNISLPTKTTIATTYRPTYTPTTTISTSSTSATTTRMTSTSSSTTTTSSTTSTTSTTSKPISTRLLIPDTSNLLIRPTVTPQRMTTDSLFKHYNQPDLPLMGPMYLIIEGHSKVKTYGKDELDPHKPKIVPIIPKREPIVRVADPNERRGTVETFQVRHLHTITTPMNILPSTTPKSTTSTSATTTTTITTTSKPILNTGSSSTTTTMKPEISTIKLNQSLELNEPSIGMQDLFSLLDSVFQNDEPTTKSTTTKLQPINITEIEKKPSVLNETEVLRDVRQVFDYDDLPESRIKPVSDIFYDDLEENLADIDNKSKREDIPLKYENNNKDNNSNDNDDDDDEEESDKLLRDIENETAQDELEELLSTEEESNEFDESARKA